MLVSHRKRFIYTKTAKTAGTSIEVYFEPYCAPEGEWTFQHGHAEYESDSGIIGYRGKKDGEKKWFNHMPAATIQRQLGKAIWDEYFKFCVVRNPFDKLVSAFHFAEAQKSGSEAGEKLRTRVKTTGNFSHQRPVEERFRSWLLQGTFPMDRAAYTIDGKICMDYFIRYEEIEDGVKHVCEVLEIPFEPERIPSLKTGFRPRDLSLRDYYSPETIQLVVERYAFEFSNFGYSTVLEADYEGRSNRKLTSGLQMLRAKVARAAGL
jgi:Sulfotransferase family